MYPNNVALCFELSIHVATPSIRIYGMMTPSFQPISSKRRSIMNRFGGMSMMSVSDGYSSSVNMGSQNGKMTVTVNGKTVIIDKPFYSLVQTDGDVYIDGVKLNVDEESDSKRPPTIEIIVQGDPESVEGNKVSVTGDVKGNVRSSTGSVVVNGVVGSVTTSTGDVEVKGNVMGGVTTSSGDVRISGSVSGSVRSSAGDIYHR
jgi:hypothetical protein